MSTFWFLAGTVVGAALVYLVLRGASREWWHWVLFVILGAWCVFGLDLAVTTYAEGNARGGNIFLIAALLTDLIGLVIVRALLTRGSEKTSVKAAAGK